MGGYSHIGEFRVIREIGSGGMGTVYLVEHPRLPRLEALKLLDAGISRQAEFRSRFEREAELLAQLQHPNIVTVYDRGEHEGRLWLAMEFVDGQDCARILKDRGSLPMGMLIDIVAGAARALDYMYGENAVTHRDVKPANILVQCGAGSVVTAVKLADFGIAKAAGESTTITSTGTTVGTMAYLSPEAIEGRELDNRADLYSLACTAFELLAGSPPYMGRTITAMLSAHLHDAPPAITARNGALPGYLDEVFRRALAKRPGDRFGTCAEFVEALQAASGIVPLVSQEYPAYADTVSAQAPSAFAPTQWAVPTSAAPQLRGGVRPATPASGRTRRWLLVAAAIGATVVVTGGVFLSAHRNSVTRPVAVDNAATPSGPVQSTLPFPGLRQAESVAVGPAGDVYVADGDSERVLVLAAGASGPQAVPFHGLEGLAGVAVDGAGNVYVLDSPVASDTGRPMPRVVMLAAGSDQQVAVPLSGVWVAGALTVSTAGDVYVADALPDGNVVRVPAGTRVPRVVPITSDGGVNSIAVDNAGNVYLTTTIGGRVLMWNAATGQQRVLPFHGLGAPRGLAVDSRGRVLVADQRNDRVVLFDVAANVQQDLKLSDLHQPRSVAIDGQVVFVADTSQRIVKLSSL